MILTISIIFSLYLLIIAWLLYGILRLRRPPAPVSLPSLSVMVAARNEGAFLGECLEALSAQDYAGDWEVLIVDDGSSDATRAIARAGVERHPRWQLLGNDYPERWRSRKKGALESALRRARGEYLLFTDADCTPPPAWVAQMAAVLASGAAVCVGFSPLTASGAPPLWRAFLHTDALAAALVAAGGIGHGRGITCTGRNLACRREALSRIGGYAALPDTLSGDDDFLLQKIAQLPGETLTYLLTPQGAVPARGPAGWRALLGQKRRHLSAGSRYTRPVQLGYFIFHSANALLWSLLFLAPLFRPWLLGFLAAKILLDGLALLVWSIRLQQPFHPGGFLLWEGLFPLYHLFAWPRPGQEISWAKP
ncbi:MAG TPA: glycosyltransferase [bacterium]|nr:glycosyltransferase [bacterium]HQI47764.1 glycosyltransferase [bacterium]HQJ63194.1 glycosyltransferase [bacterium]